MEPSVEVWKGPPALQPFIVPIDSLEPFPRNPRHGDVEELRLSLRRFGQVLPALADPSLGPEGQLRIVARHHLIEAAKLEGWTHVAVIPNKFRDEEEARAYLVADNRLGQLGIVDKEALAEQLAAVGDLAGTGYSDKARRELAEHLAPLQAEPIEPILLPADVPPVASAYRVVEIPLIFARPDRQSFVRLVRMLQREWGVDSVSAVVLRAVREAAERT